VSVRPSLPPSVQFEPINLEGIVLEISDAVETFHGGNVTDSTVFYQNVQRSGPHGPTEMLNRRRRLVDRTAECISWRPGPPQICFKVTFATYVTLCCRRRWSVCLLLRKNYSNLFIFAKFGGKAAHGPRKNPVAFDDIPNDVTLHYG